MMPKDRLDTPRGWLRHVRAHEAVVGNESWYGDGPPALGKSFTAKKTAERHADIVWLLQRAAEITETAGDRRLSRLLWELADKLYDCRPRARCASLACPKCARAFQKAKTAAQKVAIAELAKTRPNRNLVMATVIPLHLTFTPAELATLDIRKRNRWVKDVLAKARIRRVMFGSADLSWEYRRSRNYYQLHWHLAMWTKDPEKLQNRLLSIFPPENKHDRPVVVSKSFSLGFLGYMNKAIKLPDLLRRNRRGLPKLLFALDRTNPLDLMVISGLTVSARSGRLVLRPMKHKKS
jgi:hypothetical protein